MKKLSFFLLMIAVFTIFGMFSCYALSEKKAVIRVAYPNEEGNTDYDSKGNYCGYTYEYLEEIAQYTGWEYDFIRVPGDPEASKAILRQMLENGEIDLMGTMLYDQNLDENFDFSSQSYGTMETVLLVPFEDQTTIINSQTDQKYRIAVLNSQENEIQELNTYCNMNLITPEYIDCNNENDQLAALKNGSADMMLTNSFHKLDNMRSIARFASKPFYFVTGDGRNSHLMEDLNGAILSIQQTSPAFASTLYEKYFHASTPALSLTDEEKLYIQNHPTILVGVLEDEPPFQYKSDKNGSLKGISVDILSYITNKTGLQFKLISLASPTQLYDAVERGKISLVAGMPYNYELAREHHLSMTRPYVSSQYMLMMNDKTSEDSIKGKRFAMLSSSAYRSDAVSNGILFDTVSECVRAVKKGDADYTYIDAYMAQYFINLPQYQNLKLVPQTYESRKICLGIVKGEDQNLLGILNKAVYSIPTNEMQTIINQNIIPKPSFSFENFVRANPFTAVIVLALTFVFILSCLLYVIRNNIKTNRKIALDLKKHMQVYAFVNEYFFEYNYKIQKLIVSHPAKTKDDRSEIVEYDFAKEVLEDRLQQRNAFLNIILSQAGGTYEQELLCHDGLNHWLRISFETIYDGTQPAYIIGKIRIIDKEKEEKDALLKKAQLDSLTHIYNFETSKNLIEASLNQLQEEEHGGFILLDIDHFKDINDTYGHLRGDEVLSRVASLLFVNFRKDDIVGRPGGDEFLVYMKNVKDKQSFEDKCKDITQKMRELEFNNAVHLTVSIGAAISQKGDPYDKLYQLADQALYTAKDLGRDQFFILDR